LASFSESFIGNRQFDAGIDFVAVFVTFAVAAFARNSRGMFGTGRTVRSARTSTATMFFVAFSTAFISAVVVLVFVFVVVAVVIVVAISIVVVVPFGLGGWRVVTVAVAVAVVIVVSVTVVVLFGLGSWRVVAVAFAIAVLVVTIVVAFGLGGWRIVAVAVAISVASGLGGWRVGHSGRGRFASWYTSGGACGLLIVIAARLGSRLFFPAFRLRRFVLSKSGFGFLSILIHGIIFITSMVAVISDWFGCY